MIHAKLRCLGALVLCTTLCFTISAHGARKGGGKPSHGANPLMSFAVDRAEVEPGDRVLLSWTSVNTRHCSASGGWEGKQQTEGVWRSPPLMADQSFHLKCSAKGGGVQQSVSVVVNNPVSEPPTPDPEPEPEPAPEPDPIASPVVDLRASAESIDHSAEVTLSWTASNADRCDASGGWQGEKALSGTVQSGPLTASTTYSLACTGAGGTTVAMMSVQVDSAPVAAVDLQWEPPVEDTSGTVLDGLSGYVIYYGNQSQSYSESVTVQDGSASNLALTLASGQYYVAMRAIGLTGARSELSNEVLLDVP